MPFDSLLSFGDLFVDPAHRVPGPVMAELVVGDPIRDPASLLTAGGRPRLGQYQLIRYRFAGVFVPPFAHHVGQERNPRTQDVGQPGGL
jgi:hypothetical protein